MKKFFILIILLFISCMNIKAIDIDITSKEAIIYNLNDDKIIYEKIVMNKLKLQV